jgi:hypothetical protein
MLGAGTLSLETVFWRDGSGVVGVQWLKDVFGEPGA